MLESACGARWFRRCAARSLRARCGSESSSAGRRAPPHSAVEPAAFARRSRSMARQTEWRSASRQARARRRTPARRLMLRDALCSWMFPFPGREQESIDYPRLPDIAIASRRELPRVTGKNPGVMRQVVVKAKVGSLRIHERQAVADDGVAAECLLHAEDRLDAADRAFETSKGLGAIVGFDP